MPLFRKRGERFIRAELERKEFPFKVISVASLPARLVGETTDLGGAVLEGFLVDVDVDALDLEIVHTPAEALERASRGDTNWMSESRATLARIGAGFLVSEDPVRRLDVSNISSLAHQKSLIQFVQSNQPKLERVLIADEVGLGKTIEAALIVDGILKVHPGARILYLTPARLVENATLELLRLNLPFRAWQDSPEPGIPPGDIERDRCIVASIHRACLDENRERVGKNRWNVVIVDECHHLSAWEPDGGKPTNKYRLVRELLERLADPKRVLFLSGTPHQGNIDRFDNLLKLIGGASIEDANGRVIYRIKDDIKDWWGDPLFPGRDVRKATVVDLGDEYKNWFRLIHHVFQPPGCEEDREDSGQSGLRAATWRQAQAMQWAASSVEAGLGYLVRQCIRRNWDLKKPGMRDAIECLRPYRGGEPNESVERLYDRMKEQVQKSVPQTGDLGGSQDEDAEAALIGDGWKPDLYLMTQALGMGTALLKSSIGRKKWDILLNSVLHDLGNEKVVLFAQPIETVYSLRHFLEQEKGIRPALIVGGQASAERKAEIERFKLQNGPQYLISSRSGGEGINLQVARRLVHLDVPWNPMDMEQRVGRVHRFGSTQTILVDTMVVKDSREADCYRVAREKLRTISGVLGASSRFETIFMRTMSLIPPEELALVLGAAPIGPLNQEDEQALSKYIEAGFNSWKQFHDRFSENQRALAEMSPGEARWEDLREFLIMSGSAERVQGFRMPKFRAGQSSTPTCDWIDRDVVKLPQDDSLWVVDDCNGMAIKDDQGRQAFPIGLNHELVRKLFRDKVLNSTGMGVLTFTRRPQLTHEAGLIMGEKSYGVLLFLEQELRISSGPGGWEESGCRLHWYMVGKDKNVQLTAKESTTMLRSLMGDVRLARTPAIPGEALLRLKNSEQKICEELKKRVSYEEFRSGLRRAIFPWAALWVLSE